MNRPASEKSAGAYRTISEVAADLDLPQHVLRFWETRFPQVRPLKRAGGRRFYRPADVLLLADIRAKLYDEGYTIKGVQRLLRERGVKDRPVSDDGGAVGDDGLINGDPQDGILLSPQPDEAGANPTLDADGLAEPHHISAETLTESASGGVGPAASLAALRETLTLVETCERLLRAALAPSA